MFGDFGTTGGRSLFSRSFGYHRRNFRGDSGSGPPLFEWEDGPPIYKYTKSKILLGPPTFQTKVTPLLVTVQSVIQWKTHISDHLLSQHKYSQIVFNMWQKAVLHVVPLGLFMMLWWNDRFCCVHCSRDSQSFSMGRTTLKLPLNRNLIHDCIWFLGPTRVSLPPNRISIGSAVSARLTRVHNERIDTQI